jgi:transcription initiation factor TFIIA large subunit
MTRSPGAWVLTKQAGPLVSNTPVDAEDDDLDAPHDSDTPTYHDPHHSTPSQSHPKPQKPKKEIDPLDDAINSDLDDSDIDSDLDSEFGEGDDDDTQGDKSIVLCMYEKVHRTKNKWKCQLKDGVISIQGKDWVFSRANGEFEW